MRDRVRLRLATLKAPRSRRDRFYDDQPTTAAQRCLVNCDEACMSGERLLLFCKFCLSCPGRPGHAGLPPRAHAHRMVALSEERAMWAQKQTGRPEQASPIKEHHA